LIYKANAVPVGEDQAPHIELTREVARRFNYLYGKQIFPEPETLLNEFKIIPGLDKRKMSKSYNNYIEIAIAPAQIPEKVRMMITDPARIRKDDPGNPQICSVFAFQRIFNAEAVEAIAQECREGTIGCVQCKNLLAGKMKDYLEPIYHRRKEIESKPQIVDEVMARGAEQARNTAQATMKEVRAAMGLI
jgi:tryptophanyl-tRNA synthetase